MTRDAYFFEISRWACVYDKTLSCCSCKREHISRFKSVYNEFGDAVISFQSIITSVSILPRIPGSVRYLPHLPLLSFATTVFQPKCGLQGAFTTMYENS